MKHRVSTGRSAATAMALTALFALAAPLAAQEAAGRPANDLAFEGQISGTVFDQAKHPVSGASVAVLGAEGSTIHASNTDTRGRYALKGLARDEYAVLVMDPSGTLLRKDKVRVRPLFRNLVDFVTGPAGAQQPVQPALPGGESHNLPPFDLKVSMETQDGVPVSEAWFTAAPLSGEHPVRRARTSATGELLLEGLPAGYYRFTARALGHVTWSLGPLLMQGQEERELLLTLMPFPLGHKERIENLLVPVQPALPDRFEEETAPAAALPDPNTPDPS